MYDILKKSVKDMFAFLVIFGIFAIMFYGTAIVFGYWLRIVIKFAL